MSYILDALRKSEQSRRPGGPVRSSGAVHELRVPIPSRGWLLALGVMLLFSLLAGLLIFWRGLSQEPATLPPPAVVTETPSSPDPVVPVANAVPAVTEPRANTAEEKTTAPETPGLKNSAAVLDLSEQAPSARVTPKPRKAKTKVQQAKVRAPSTRGIVPAAPPMVSDGIPFLSQMPSEVQRQLPPLKVTIHVYSPDESQQILFLNNHEYHKGDQIEAGIRVEEIVPEGAVLSYQGERFKISRPN
ncbi:MAG: general secretion pathway protein GspB [Pseudomonadota bacterium]